ncbi:hypothetical protein EVAR_54076_1 [Eumeta japonica]|uniref:Uncharacterized protein n=1 Tax=Eumeta variegata TaxID=151549 RepID=A0A4C1XDR5_EUMVA|nr:hypothetical protein EVAR_54076_1 [Eumeta japonica]
MIRLVSSLTYPVIEVCPSTISLFTRTKLLDLKPSALAQSGSRTNVRDWSRPCAGGYAHAGVCYGVGHEEKSNNISFSIKTKGHDDVCTEGGSAVKSVALKSNELVSDRRRTGQRDFDRRRVEPAAPCLGQHVQPSEAAASAALQTAVVGSAPPRGAGTGDLRPEPLDLKYHNCGAGVYVKGR